MATFDVLLPVKNGIAYLAEAIDSIRAQTFKDWRLLILDHGSSDGCIELAQAYVENDPRIELHLLPHAVGLSGLLNLGLDRCDCRYVLRQDADDVSLPNRMAVLAEAYQTDRQLAVIGSLGDVIDAGGRKIGVIDMPIGSHGLAAAALFHTPVCHPAASMRLEVLQSLGARYGEDFVHALPKAKQIQVPGLAEDYFLFGQLALLAPCRNVEQGLIKYRWHGNNIGATRYLDQMRVALTISRNLADSLALMRGVPSVDPAPFCTHGEALFEVEGRNDFSTEYSALQRLLKKSVPDGADLQRELAFRHVVSIRSSPQLALRFLGFAARHGTRQSERRAVKSWLLRGLHRQPMLTLPSLVQPT
jgi:glycosyltransferase involved in cell wall biosynthesis